MRLCHDRSSGPHLSPDDQSVFLLCLALIRSGLTRPCEMLFKQWRRTATHFRRLKGMVNGGFLSREDTPPIRHNAPFLRQALDTIPDAYWLVDNDGFIRDSNAAAEAMLGYPPGGLNGLHIEAIDCNEGTKAVLDHLEKVRRLGYDRFETRHRHRSGNLIDVEVSARYLDHGGGHYLVFTRDITKPKQAAERLKQSERKFAAVFYRNPLPMAISDIDDGTYIDVNEAFVRESGYAKSDCLGRRSTEMGLVTLATRERIKSELLEHQRVHAMTLTVVNKNGAQILARYSGEIITLGSKPRLLSIISNITKEVQTAKEQEVSEKLLRLINQQHDLLTFEQETVAMLQQWVGCQAVGIRLQEGTVFPYVAAVGFTTTLPACAAPPVDADPEDRLPCVCRAVLTDQTDPKMQGFTPQGSFWTSRISADIQNPGTFRIGSCCMRDEFESIALIPLRFGEAILGVLHLADPRPDGFDADRVRLCERIASNLSVALKARQDLEALQLSEHRYRTLYENAPVGIFTTTTAGRAIDGNPEMARMIGYDTPAAAVANYTDMGRQLYVDPKRRKQVIDQMKAAGQVKAIEYEAVTRQGHRIWLRVDARLGDALPDGDALIEGFAVDVTDSKEKEKQLQLQAMVLDQISDQVVVTDLNGRIAYVNDAQVQALGYRRDEMIGQMTTAFGEDTTRWASQQEVVERTVADGQWRGEIVKITKTGQRRLLHCRTRRITDHQGKTIAYCGISTDVTEHRSREHELQRLASAIDHVAEAIMVTEPDGSIVFVNPSFEEITGYRRDEVIGKNPRLMKSGVHDGYFYSELWDTLNAGLTWSGQITNRRKDGSHYIEKCTISPIFGKTGEIINFVAVKNDITEEVQLEKQLIQAQKMEAIGTLAGGIAHDFNNILFPMVGFSEMLREDLPADSPLQEYVTDILASAMRARDLVQQILAFSRQSDRERTAIRVQHILKEVSKLIRASLPSNIEIKMEIDGVCPPVLADPTQIHQIVMNLITNAYHAMEPEGGRLTLALASYRVDGKDLSRPLLAPGDYVRLTVADTGKGIDGAILGHIFDPYFTTKAEGKGTGLGLSVIHGIVSEYAGDIQVESRPGRGTSFTILLPCLNRPIENKIPPEAEAIQGGNERILLVDDEMAIVNIVEKMLTRLGYAVTACTSSKDALAAFQNDPSRFDLVVSDMTMPGMTGDQLIQALKKIRADIPVVLCTGFSNQIDEAGAVCLGAAGFVFKPILKHDIADAIRKALEAVGR